MKKYVVLTLALLILACASLSNAAEFRAFWVDAWGAGGLNQSQVNTLLGTVGTTEKGQLREANCNAVIFQIRRSCDVNYPSGIGEPYMSGLSPSNFNSLQAVIDAAHDTTGGKKRIEVHAWMVMFRTAAGVVYNQHISTPTGSLTNLDNYWQTINNSGAEAGDSDKQFDPGHPLAAQYCVDAAMDVVSRFDIDAIHYDYVRFTASNQGYNPTSVARYNQYYGLSGQPVYTNEQWKQWRRDQVTAVVRKIYAKIQSVKPWVQQTASTVTWNPSPTASTRAAFQATRPYYDVYSDWDSWLEEGILDAVMPMTYYDYASLPNDYKKWMNYEKDRKHNRHMYIGPGIYLNSLDNSLLELKMTRDASPAGNYAQGYAGYSYRVPYVSGTWAGFETRLKNEVNPTGEDLPVMSWKVNPTKGHISGTVTYYATGKLADGAFGTQVSISGPASRTMKCDGTGFYAFIDLPPGSYTVTATHPGYPNSVKTVNVAIGAVTGNMYITDFQLGANQPPVISGVGVSNVTNASATVNWITDEASTSRVQYGLTTGYGMLTAVDNNEVTSHSQVLSGLSPNTLYHYRVISTNANGQSTSEDYTFVTSGPPAISAVTPTAITSTSATITWTTNAPADSKVNYGLSTGYGSQNGDSSHVTSHSITITGLTANTTYNYQCVSTNSYGTATSTNYTFKTNAVPTISNVTSSSITSSSATITWTTNQAADSKVNYGLTTGYTSQKTDSAQTTSHTIALTGLAANTTYHYQCVSQNANGTATSTDYTFKTNEAPVETILDNKDAAFVGTWSTATGGYDNDHRYIRRGASGATSSATWTPNLSAGRYDVYVYYPSRANATANAPFTIYHKNGSTAVSVNQTTNTGTWLKIGSNVAFNSGTGGYVRLGIVTGESSSRKEVVADAVKFVYVGELGPDDLIVNNGDPGTSYTGTWNAGTYGSGYNNDYLFADCASTATAVYKWTPAVQTTALYDVYCWYTNGSNRASDASYKIYHADGSVTVAINQQANGGQWVLLASGLRFAAGTAGYVTLDNKATGNVVIADAIKLAYAGPAAPIDNTPPSISIGAPSASLTKSGPVTFAVNYSDDTAVTAITLANANVTLNKTGTANGTIAISGTGNASRTVTISNITGDGSLGISIAAGTAKDAAGNTAPAAGPSATFAVDNTAPVVTAVTDEVYTTSKTTLQAWWSASDSGSGLDRCEYAVGSTPGGTNIKGWTNAGAATSAQITGLSLATNGVYYISVRAIDNVGLTSTVSTSAGVRVAQEVTSIPAAMALPDDSAVLLPARSITAAFTGAFYIEEPKRAAGIRVESSDAVSVGQSAKVFGVMGVVNGERAILGSKIPQIGAGNQIAPLLVTGKSVGSAGSAEVYNIGLLLRAAGKVSNKVAGSFIISDGSGVTVKVYSNAVVTNGSFVGATGISALENGQRVLRTRFDNDVRIYAP